MRQHSRFNVATNKQVVFPLGFLGEKGISNIVGSSGTTIVPFQKTNKEYKYIYRYVFYRCVCIYIWKKFKI